MRVGAEAHAGRALLDGLEGVLDLQAGVRVSTASRVIWATGRRRERAHLVEAALRGEGRVVVVVRVAVHSGSCAQRELADESRRGATTRRASERRWSRPTRAPQSPAVTGAAGV